MESTIVPSQSNKYAPNDPSGNFSFIGFFVSLPKIFLKVTRDPEQLRDPACPERSAVFASCMPHRDRRELRALCAAKDLNVKMLQNLKLILLSRLPCRGKLFHQFLFAFQQFAQPSTTRVGFDRFLYLRQLLLDLPAAQGIQAALRFFPSGLLRVFKYNLKKYAPIPLVQLRAYFRCGNWLVRR